MGSFRTLPSKLFFGALCLFGTSQAAATSCNANNCYRALFPTGNPTALSSASAFCSTYIQSTITATTGFPTRATSACGTSPSKYSSACSCLPSSTSTSTTPTSTCSPTPAAVIVKNGAFECGLALWTAAAVTGTTYAITTPGAGDGHAFEVDQNIPPDTSTGMEQASVQQTVTLVPGTNYVLTFYTYFNNGNPGFIGVKLNNKAIWTVDARDGLGPGAFRVNNVPFTASAAQTVLRFEFIFGAQAVDKIDGVSIAVAT